jgi:hypothetical protein
MMNYLVAVLSNRMQAEAAYSALEKEGLPSGQVDILGSGYKSADDYGLIDPSREARTGTKRQLYWLVPFGFAAGFAFNVLTGIDIIPSLPPIGNRILGGLLKGTDQLTRQATRVLRQFEPENIQGYIEPMSA